MSLRDELLVAVRSWPQNDYDTRILVETILMPIIERALAVERAALKADIYDRLAQPLQVIIVHAGMMGEEHVERAVERFAKELRALNTDRSALDDALAQARREQREKDAQIAEDDDNPHRSAGVAAAIRAPAAPVRQRGEQED